MSCNTCAKQATATMAAVGVPPSQVQTIYGNRSVGQTWQYLPRCPGCKKWASPKHGLCHYARCKLKGTLVVQPTGWPPTGDRILRTKAAVAVALQEERAEGYKRLMGMTGFAHLSDEAMETVVEDGLRDAPKEPTPEDWQTWQDEAQRLLDHAEAQGVRLPVQGDQMSPAEAYAYSELGKQVSYPDEAERQAEAIIDDMMANSGASIYYAPQAYLIREEENPDNPDKLLYQVYNQRGTPLFSANSPDLKLNCINLWLV